MYFNLNTDKDSYEWDKTGSFRSVYGKLFIEIGGNIFPEEDWIDIISSVLNMWVDNIINLLQSNLSGEKDLFFMDGPYYFKVKGAEDEMVHISLFKNYKQVNEKPYEVSFYNFLSEISKVIVSLNMDERLKEIENIKQLRKKYTCLKKIAKGKGYKI